MINKAILQGRLTAAPELKYTQSDKPVTSFTLAVDRGYKQENGPTADFINCVAWSKTAEFITRYFIKGQEMAVVGEIQTRSYTDNAGAKRYVTEVNVREVHFCGPKAQAEEPDAETPSQPTQDINAYADDDDDLPF